ncbi:MAG: hypothetical protein RR540_02890 [Oscillospiraceae bacterium]
MLTRFCKSSAVCTIFALKENAFWYCIIFTIWSAISAEETSRKPFLISAFSSATAAPELAVSRNSLSPSGLHIYLTDLQIIKTPQ